MSEQTNNSNILESLSQVERLYRIVREGMCIGCGLCESIAGTDTIEMRVNELNYERPFIIGDLSRETVDKIYYACPGLRQDGLPESMIAEDTPVYPVMGPIRYAAIAHASNDSVRIKAASGGVLTAIANYLVESGEVSFVLHAMPSNRDATFGDAHVSCTTVDVAKGTGSIYGPTAILRSFHRLLDRGLPFAVIGKPCDISATRNLARLDPRIDDLVKYRLSPICGGTVSSPQMNRFLEGKGVKRDDLKWFKYRGDGCPGSTEFETRDGRMVSVNMYEPYGGVGEGSWQIPFRCKICPDGTGESADVSAGDLDWKDVPFDKGSNVLIARTHNGHKIVKSAIEQGYLTIENVVDPETLENSQMHLVKKKKFMRARCDGLKAEGRLSPVANNLRLEALAASNSYAENEREMSGTRERIRLGQPDEPTPQTDRS